MSEQSLRLDIVPVMPGAASLGAYQAGAAAAVVVGRNVLVRNGHDVRIPAVGGASAGATVALLAGHCLAHALDPVQVLHAAWVEGVDLELLTSGDSAPLGHAGLRDELAEMLVGSAGVAPGDGVEPSDVDIHVSLTALRGRRYRLDHLGDRPTDAVTYADWEDIRYPAGGDPAALIASDGRSLLDLVIASLANPAVFPPVLLDRPDSNGTRNRRWYTDGGLVQSRPIQRTLDLVEHNGQHVHCVVIDPRSEGPTTGEEWADPDRDDDWLGALVRAMSIFPAQVLSDELRRLDEENQVRRTMRELADVIDSIEDPAVRNWVDQWDATPGAGTLGALLAAAGVDSPRDVRADVIHPLLIAGDEDVPALLAGELLGDFAGFLDVELRRSDFALGYACGSAWWQTALDEYGLSGSVPSLAAGLESAGPSPWEEVRRGRLGLSELPWSARAGLAKVLARALQALVKR